MPQSSATTMRSACICLSPQRMHSATTFGISTLDRSSTPRITVLPGSFSRIDVSRFRLRRLDRDLLHGGVGELGEERIARRPHAERHVYPCCAVTRRTTIRSARAQFGPQAELKFLARDFNGVPAAECLSVKAFARQTGGGVVMAKKGSSKKKGAVANMRLSGSSIADPQATRITRIRSTNSCRGLQTQGSTTATPRSSVPRTRTTIFPFSTSLPPTW